MKDQTGQQLGNYRLIQLLGHGGFAQVYLAEHIYLRTQAAIKVLQVELAEDGRIQFLEEARTIAKLIHPHIIRILDFGVESSSNTPYLVMDYAPNGTLRQRYPKGTQVQLSTIVPYVKQLASALHYAHTHNIIHRDVKPGNILLGQEQNVFLSDFGIATIAHNSMSQSTEDTVLGTIAYMAPEQIQGKPRPASDQYALGIVVYEWLCGDRPFHGSFAEIVVQQMTADPPPLRERIPNISPDVEEVISIAMAKNPKERFASVEIFAHALEQASLSEKHTEANVYPNAQPFQPVTVSPSSPIVQSSSTAKKQAIPATTQPARTAQTRPRPNRASGSGNEQAASQGLPPTVYVGQSSQTLQHQHGTEQKQPPTTESRKRSSFLGLRGTSLAGTFVSLLLLTGLIVLTLHSATLPQVNIADLSTLAFLVLITDITLVCASAILGPVAGVLLGTVGFFLGDYINTLTVSGYTLHPFQRYLLTTLAGLIVGLLARTTLGSHKLSRALSLTLVDIIGAVVVLVGLPLALAGQSILANVIAVALSLVLVPLIVQLCKAIVGHR